MAAPPHRLRFAGFELDPATGDLRRDGEPVPLQPQPAQVLVALAERAGRVVLRAELEDLLWEPDQHVDRDQGLNYCIRQVRQALGDSGSDPEFVETLPRRGYRFLPEVEGVAVPAEPGGPAPGPVPAAAGVEPAAEPMTPAPPTADRVGRGDGEAQWRRGPALLAAGLLVATAALVVALFLPGRSQVPGIADEGGPAAATDRRGPGAAAEASRDRLAVLPLETLPPAAAAADAAGGEGAAEGATGWDATPAFFAAGLTEELTSALGRLDPERLAVLAPGAVVRARRHGDDPAEMARRLDADYFLAGSILHSADRLRVAVRLIAADDQVQLWSETYEAGTRDAFEVQQDVARRVAEALSLRLPVAPAADAPVPEAFEAYLQGIYLENQPLPHPDSVPHLERAVRLDPGYARAWAQLAQAYRQRRPYRAGDLERALTAVERALELDPGSPHAHLERGMIAFRHEFDVELAHRHLRRAVELHPTHAVARMRYAGVLSALGRHRRADEELRRALTLDPDSLMILGDLGWFSLFARDYDAAAESLRATLALDPADDDYWSRRCLLAVYVVSQRWPEAEALVVDWPEEAFAGHATQAVPGDPRATVHAFLRDELVYLEDLTERGYLAPAVTAMDYAILGDTERALDLLERSVDERWGWTVPFLRVDPRFDPLRAEPRFVRLGERLDLPDPRAAGSG